MTRPSRLLKRIARVLVVEADNVLRSRAVDALRKEFDVVEASTGAEAIALFTSSRLDLIVLDATLPELNGFSVCSTLRAMPGGREIPILITTGVEDGDAIDLAYEAGATDFMTKPIDGGLLRHRLRYLLRAATAISEAERQVHDLAYYDSLTRLPNRAFIRSFLRQSLVEARHAGRSAAVLALDLNGFSQVNDSFGRTGGDEVICEVARRIEACVRSTDTGLSGDLDRSGDPTHHGLVAHLGGDEFLVVLHDIHSPDDAAIVAQRIADELARGHRVGDADLFVSSSIGIATFPRDADDVETLLDRADVAMYNAKQGDRNRFRFYTPSMHEESRARLELETNLRTALGRSRIIRSSGDGTEAASHPSEFHLVYQPKVEVPSGKVVGVEALLRWTSPRRGLVSPTEFIGAAEDTGLIVPLGAWVLRTACAQAKAWSMSDQPLRVAVNVSARQFREPGFAALVAFVLEKTQLEPALLELELTEGTVMEDTGASTRVLEDLKALGIRIALDDFGTGYSSLSYLTRLPIDALKIDRSFIRDLGREGRGEAITAAIIALSQSLKIDVVVEGVENEAQLAFVRSQGTAEVQGFYFARPMAPSEIGKWRAHHDSQHTLVVTALREAPRDVAWSTVGS